MAISPDQYRWAFSTLAARTDFQLFIPGNTYDIVDYWAVNNLQSDQTLPILKWREPDRELTTRPKLSQYTLNMDYSVRADGTWSFNWGWKWFTPGQFNYINYYQFSNGTVWSAPCSVQTWHENDTSNPANAGLGYWTCYAGTCLRPLPGEHYKIVDNLYTDVVYRFVGMTVLS